MNSKTYAIRDNSIFPAKFAIFLEFCKALFLQKAKFLAKSTKDSYKTSKYICKILVRSVGCVLFIPLLQYYSYNITKLFFQWLSNAFSNINLKALKRVPKNLRDFLRKFTKIKIVYL